VSKKLKSDKESNKIIDYFTVNRQFIINNNGYGTNKTRSIIHSINSNPDLSFVYFAPRHDLLQEVSQQLTIKHTIWEGWSRKCKQKSGIKTRLINAGVPASIICHQCQYKSDCQYISQFNNKTNILLPTTYVNYTAKLSTVSADVFFFDEAISSWEILKDKGILVGEGADQIISRMLNTNDSEELIYHAKKLMQIQYLAAKVELKTNERIIYYPNLYRIFRLLRQKKKVVITDANLSRDEFETLLKRYPEYSKLPVPYWIPLVKDRKLNLRVYCPFPNRSFHKNHFYKDMKDYHAYIMKLIFDLKRKGHRLCVVTFKDWEWAFYSWQLKTDVFHFDANAGSNQFRNFDTIIVVGSYFENPKVAADFHSYLTGDIVEIDNWEDYSQKLPKATRDLFENREMAKNLEAVYRIRPDNQRAKVVIYFGRVPELLKEFYYKTDWRLMEMEIGLDGERTANVNFGLLMDIAYALETSKNVTEAERKLGWSGPTKRQVLKGLMAVLKT
jgi:hypothetical protein